MLLYSAPHKSPNKADLLLDLEAMHAEYIYGLLDSLENLDLDRITVARDFSLAAKALDDEQEYAPQVDDAIAQAVLAGWDHKDAVRTLSIVAHMIYLRESGVDLNE